MEKNKVEPGRGHVASGELRCPKIMGKPQPYDDIQISRNGLIYTRELAINKLESSAKQLYWILTSESLFHKQLWGSTGGEKSVHWDWEPQRKTSKYSYLSVIADFLHHDVY